MTGYPREGETFGDYQVDGVLGRGGMGVVYAATHARIGRRVALKVIAPELAGNDEYRARFLHETATLVRLDSPHIIQVLDHGEVDGSLFIATQLVSGADLAHRLEDGPLPVGTALTLAVQITSGVADAHRGGVLHRDIKPSNVLVTGSADAPFAYLCDFGIARDTEPDQGLTATGAVIGTFPYLAPERFGGAPATRTTDVYALGCLLWTMLTGATPYAGTPFTLAREHLEAPVRQLAADAPWVEDLNGVLLQAMAKDPAERFASVDAMRVALDHVLAEVPMQVRRLAVRPAGAAVPPPPPPPPPVFATPLPTPTPPLPEPVGVPARRTGSITLAAGVAALVVVGVVAVVLRPWAAGDEPRADPAGTPSSRATTADTGEVGGVATTRSDEPAGQSDRPAPIEVRVHDTCGDGSCYLQVRTGPSTDDAEARNDQGKSERWDDGTVHEVVCWEHGETVSSQSVGRSSDRWARTVDENWVAMLHLAGTSADDPSVPPC